MIYFTANFILESWLTVAVDALDAVLVVAPVGILALHAASVTVLSLDGFTSYFSSSLRKRRIFIWVSRNRRMHAGSAGCIGASGILFSVNKLAKGGEVVAW